MNIIQVRKLILSGFVALFTAMCSYTVLASHGLENDKLELDADVLNANTAGLPDWEAVNDPNSLIGIAEFFAKDKNGSDTIFSGGQSKDEKDVSEWKFRSGSPQPKDDITNAYAMAAYNDLGELLLYFGGDRYANNGDTHVGVWFLQDSVGIPEGQTRGSFEGVHKDGDILVLISFPQSANGRPYVQILEWTTNPDATTVADNLVERYVTFGDPKDDSFVGAKCGEEYEGNDLICAITNATSTPLPNVLGWTYEAKTGETDEFPHESFVEGRLNLTKLFEGRDIPCISTFLVETRASRSIDAALADFVVGSFELCKIEVAKTCAATSFNNNGTFNIDYTIQIKNAGPGTLPVDELVTIDDTPSNGTAFSDSGYPEDLGAGNDVWAVNEVIEFTGSYISSVNGGTNTVTATASTGPTSTISDDLDKPEPCTPLPLTPLISIDKSCDTYLDATGSVLAVAKQYTVDICNTGNVPLEITSLTDNMDTSLSAPFDKLDYALSCNGTDDTVSCGAGNTCAVFNSESDLYACKDGDNAWIPASGGNICESVTRTYYPTMLTELEGQYGTLSNQATVTATSPVADTKDLEYPGQTSNTATCDLCPNPQDQPASD
ncbi:hypothetical protein [Vibrio sp. EA2]|uniref:hypothetical protein n=1 Tax=Vibrio sp. EA2 TaxID=3079860 RepID=UPI0029496EC5|nr:hypothetical protein [Vibrio sp. EA2]MDV6250099.1 hypothetical protein [Vibrio sp. EA2]